MMHLCARYLHHSGRVITVLVIAGLASMVLLNGANVTFRSLGYRSIHWAHEISLLIAMGVYFLSYGLIVRHHAEIRVRFLVIRLPTRLRTTLDLLGDLLQFALYVVIGFLAWRYALRMSILPMPITKLSEGLIYIPVVVGFTDSAAAIVLRLVVNGGRPGASVQPTEMG